MLLWQMAGPRLSLSRDDEVASPVLFRNPRGHHSTVRPRLNGVQLRQLPLRTVRQSHLRLGKLTLALLKIPQTQPYSRPK